ncbi:MAG TPA: radical SAM protein [Candidatus Korarchaeota archaeon]|nr:radical SAM protein [Candidatus Korarchaeota archaeon]
MQPVRVLGGVYIPDEEVPREVHVELTARCNLNCAFCYRRSWPGPFEHMDFDLFRMVVRELEDVGVEVVWLSGWGEPLYHPRFREALELLAGKFRIGIISNGVLLREYARDIVDAGVDWVVLSVDSFQRDLYEVLREGAQLESVKEGMAYLDALRREAGGKPSIWISTILMRSNYRGLPEHVDRASKLGANGLLLSNLIPTTPDLVKETLYNDAPPEDLQSVMHRTRMRAVITNVRLVEPEFRYRTERSCPFINNRMLAITWNGDISPCLFALHDYVAWIDGREKRVKRIAFGNLRNSSLMEIWNSRDYVRFRAYVRLALYPSCNDCQFEEFCDFAASNETDCWGNSPSCAACPYYRRIVQCPYSRLIEVVKLIRQYPVH